MGNCCFLLKKTRCSPVLRITKSDGKNLAYREPVPVKDVLFNYRGHKTSHSKNTTKNLPLEYELRLGKRHYLLPLIDEQRSFPTHHVRPGSSKRIKVVITKQQLQELLEKNMSLQHVLSSVPNKKASHGVDSRASWRPKLETIPEETST